MSVGQLERDLRRRKDFVKRLSVQTGNLEKIRTTWEGSEGKILDKKVRKGLRKWEDLRKKVVISKSNGKGRRVRVRNRCVLSSRGRGVLRLFKRARREVLKGIRLGERRGVRKGSW